MVIFVITQTPMIADLEKTYSSLFQYCQNEDFAGFDPFDGLNSRFFSLTPLKYLAPARLAWLQMVKRSPVDLRSTLRVKKGENSKGIALFALAELSRFRATRSAVHAENVRVLLERLDKHAIGGTTASGSPYIAFGYNFDWQSRQFFAAKGTPTIVPTTFAARTYLEAFELFGDEVYLENARRICVFITDCLQRPVENADEICFSYTPTNSGPIYNASLMAGETLARVGHYTDGDEYRDLAARSLRYVLNAQAADGSWQYGPQLRHRWVDNFHTAYLLASISKMSNYLQAPPLDCDAAIGRGIDYWRANFFWDDGMPKYFDVSTYPVDIHSAAAAIWAFCELHEKDERMLPMAEKVADWTIANMRDKAGYFYYQKRRRGIVKIPFMRWGQAWMAFALARLIETRHFASN